MKNKFNNIPKSLKIQIIVRLGIGVLSLLIAISMSVIAKDFILSLPCLFLFAFMGINGGNLLFNGITRNYVTVSGTCIDLYYSRIFKRIKTIVIKTEKGIFKLLIRKRVRQLSKGTTVTVYIPIKSRIYVNDQEMTILNYYAIDAFSTK